MYLTPLYLLFCGSAFPPSWGKLSVEGKWDYIRAKLCIKTPDMRTKGDSVCFCWRYWFLDHSLIVLIFFVVCFFFTLFHLDVCLCCVTSQRCSQWSGRFFQNSQCPACAMKWAKSLVCIQMSTMSQCNLDHMGLTNNWDKKKLILPMNQN